MQSMKAINRFSSVTIGLICCLLAPNMFAADWKAHIMAGDVFYIVLNECAKKMDDPDSGGGQGPMGTVKCGETYTLVWRDGAFTSTGFNQGSKSAYTMESSKGDPKAYQISVFGRIFKYDREGKVLDPQYGVVGHLTTDPRKTDKKRKKRESLWDKRKGESLWDK